LFPDAEDGGRHDHDDHQRSRDPLRPLQVLDRGALAPLAGVASARVDIPARTVTVEVDETMTDRARLVAAIEEQGYDVPA
jgi:hypothetical protein